MNGIAWIWQLTSAPQVACLSKCVVVAAAQLQGRDEPSLWCSSTVWIALLVQSYQIPHVMMQQNIILATRGLLGEREQLIK